MPSDLQADIERLYAEPPAAYGLEERTLFEHFKQALNRGEIRAAEPDAGSPTGWRVNPWVKQGILIGFRMGEIVDMSVGAARRVCACHSSTRRPILPGRWWWAMACGWCQAARRSVTGAIWAAE